MAALVAGAVLIVAACRGGASGTTVGAPELHWASGRAEAANGHAPTLAAGPVCGSANATYLNELLTVSPTAAKVLREWGDAVPGGRQLAVSGRVASASLGPTDLPMSHPFGDDLSLDIDIEAPFRPFNQHLGPFTAGNGRMHAEISSGLIPHGPTAQGGYAGQTWRQASDADLTGFLPGFAKPGAGDPVLAMGRWIIDCGHPNFQTELHPLSFLAWAHPVGAATVVRAYANPYRDTETYTMDTAALGRVSDAARFSAPGAKPFVPFLVSSLLAVATGQADHLSSRELIEAPRALPPAIVVCAPKGTRGPHLQVGYDLVARPGVSVTVTTDTGAGCATVRAVIGPDYRASDLALRQCAMPWAFLDDVAKGSLSSTVDVKGLLDRNVPAAFRAAVDRDPDTTCADPLSGPPVTDRPQGQDVRTDAAQPFPLYGVITVERRG